MLRREAHRFIPANHSRKRLQMLIRRVFGLYAAAHKIANRVEGVERGVSDVPNLQ